MSARILPFFTRPGVTRRGAAERAFLPAALEIVESPASPTLRLTAFLIALFLAAACVWSYFGWIDIHAVAQGKTETAAALRAFHSFALSHGKST